MNQVLGAVLGIRVTLQGMSAVIGGLRSLSQNVKFSASQIAVAVQGVKELGAEVGLLVGALMKAGEDETMRLTLQGVTNDAGLALDQIRFIRAETSKGLFDKADLAKTVQLFDQSHESLSRFLPLTEEIALRSHKSLSETARYIAELGGGGTARLMGLLKPAGITIDQLRAAGLNVNEHYKTNASAEQILAALEKITSKDSIMGLLGGSFMAAYKGDLADIVDSTLR